MLSESDESPGRLLSNKRIERRDLMMKPKKIIVSVLPEHVRLGFGGEKGNFELSLRTEKP